MLNNKGISILEVVIASSIALISGMGLVRMTMINQKSQTNIEMVYDMNNVVLQMKYLLTSKEACENTLMGRRPGGNGQTFTQIRDASPGGGRARFFRNQTFPITDPPLTRQQASVVINSMRVQDYTVLDAATNTGTAVVYVTFDKLRDGFSNQGVKSFPVLVGLNAGGAIVRCVTDDQNQQSSFCKDVLGWTWSGGQCIAPYYGSP